MAELREKLQKLLEEAVENGEVAGANLLVMKNGKKIAYADAGYANVEEQKPYKRDTIFRLYSISKPITAAAAMILMERGQLDIGKPVGDILPAFRDIKVWEKGQEVSPRKALLVKDLLSMTSGLSYGSLNADDPAGNGVLKVWVEVDRRLYSDNPMSTEELVTRLAECGLCFHPGEYWMYGTSADVLGAVIEKVSGMKLGEFLQKELFTPLGMEDTGFYVPQEKQHRLADAYESTSNGVKLFKTNHLGIKYTLDQAPAFESGGAGLVSTLDDYAKFARMLLNGGRHEDIQILSPQTVRFFTSAKLLSWQQESLWRGWDGMAGYGYGNLMRIMEEPGMAHFQTWKGEYGWDGWLGAYFINSPSNGVTVLMSCQKKDGGTMDLTRKVRNVLAANID